MPFDPSTAQPEAVQSGFDPSTATLVSESPSFDPSTAKPDTQASNFDPSTAKPAEDEQPQLRAATPEDMQQPNWLERSWHKATGGIQELGTAVSERSTEAMKAMRANSNATDHSAGATNLLGAIGGAAAMLRPSPGEQARDQREKELQLGPEFTQTVAQNEKQKRSIGDLSGEEQLFGSDKSPLALPLWAPGQEIGKQNVMTPLAKPITKEDENVEIPLGFTGGSVKLSSVKAVYQPFAKVWNMVTSPGSIMTLGAGTEVAAAKVGTEALGATAAITPAETAATAIFSKGMTEGAIQQLDALPGILRDPNKTTAQKFAASTDAAVSVGMSYLSLNHLSGEVKRIASDPLLSNEAKVDALAEAQDISHDAVLQEVGEAADAKGEQIQRLLKPLPANAQISIPKEGEIGTPTVTIPGKEGGESRSPNINEPAHEFQGSPEEAKAAGWDITQQEHPSGEGTVATDFSLDGMQKLVETEGEKPSTDTWIPPEVKGAEEPTTTETPASGETYGIAARVSAERAKAGKIEPIQPGEGTTPQEIIQKGRDLLDQGADPQAVADRVRNTGASSENDVAIARAHGEDLAQAAKAAADKFGVDSPEYAAAKKADYEWQQNVIQPMRTAWHKKGMAMQSETDIDTESYHGLAKAVHDITGEDLDPKQSKQAKDLSDQAAKLKDEVETLKKKVLDGVKNAAPETPKVAKKGLGLGDYFKDSAAAARERMRARMTQAGANPFLDPKKVAESIGDLSILAAEHLAKGLDAGAELVKEFGEGINLHLDAILKSANDAIQSAYETKSADALEKRRVAIEKQIAEKKAALASGDVQAKPKELNRPQPEAIEKAKQELEEVNRQIAEARKAIPANEEKNVTQDVWTRAKDLLEKGEDDYPSIVNKIATDTGLPEEQIHKILAGPKEVRTMTDEMYRKMADRRNLVRQAQDWVKDQQTPGYIKAVKMLPNAMFRVSTALHGTVFGVTHAAINIFNPLEWSTYWPNFFRQFRLMGLTDGGAYHERMMQQLEADPLFDFASRAGLNNNPHRITDDFQSAWTTHYLRQIGMMGNRGMDAIKIMRQAMFNNAWEKYSPELRTPDGAKLLADAVNHATGSIRARLPGWTQYTFFSARLEGSRWAWMIQDPAKAGEIFTRWATGKDTTYGERMFAMRELKQKAAIVGTYMGLLAANQGLLSASDSKQKINFIDPTKPDFLTFKAGGKELSPVSPMLGLVRLFSNLAHITMGNRDKFEKRDTKFDEAAQKVGEYARGRLSPFAGVATDTTTGADAVGREMPWANMEIPPSGRISSNMLRQEERKYTYTEYATTHFLPLFAEEAVREVWKKQGVGETTMQHWIDGLSTAALMGTTGFKLKEDPSVKK